MEKSIYLAVIQLCEVVVLQVLGADTDGSFLDDSDSVAHHFLLPLPILLSGLLLIFAFKIDLLLNVTFDQRRCIFVWPSTKINIIVATFDQVD